MIEKKLDLILQEIVSLKNDVQELKEEQSLMRQDIESLKEEQSLMRQDIENLKAEQLSLKEEQALFRQELADLKSAMNHRFDTLETKFGMLENKFDSLQEQVAINCEDIKELKVGQKELLSRMEKFEQIQERQEKTIDLLARRSIDQEAEIRKIK